MKFFRFIAVFFAAGLGLLRTCGAVETNFSSGNMSDVKIQALRDVFEQEEISDARFKAVKGYDGLVFSQEARMKLDEILLVSDFQEQKAQLSGLLEKANADSQSWAEMEWNRLTSEKQAEYRDFRDEYTVRSADELQRLKAEIDSLHSSHQLKKWVKKLQNAFESRRRETGETGRSILSAVAKPFVYGWMGHHILTDDRSAHTANFKDARVYRAQNILSRESEGVLEASLLQQYAPTVVIEKTDSNAYDPSIDALGKVYLTGSDLQDAIPHVDTEEPTVYGYSRRIQIGHDSVLQLVYVIWFPEHPHVKGENDPEAGILEGWTVRISLNHDLHPVIAESVSNCGCYYKIFPYPQLEESARLEFGSVIPGKHFYLENSVSQKIDVTLPEILNIQQTQSGALALYYEAGTHQLLTMSAAEDLQEHVGSADAYSYRLAPYDELESLDFNGREASLFEPSGLVRQAHRAECTLLAPTGMFHAGHPRQRTTQLIYFDQYEFDNPHLLEEYLRLPKHAFGSDD